MQTPGISVYPLDIKIILSFRFIFQAPDVPTTLSLAPVSSGAANTDRTENLVYVRLIRKYKSLHFLEYSIYLFTLREVIGTMKNIWDTRDNRFIIVSICRLLSFMRIVQIRNWKAVWINSGIINVRFWWWWCLCLVFSLHKREWFPCEGSLMWEYNMEINKSPRMVGVARI